MSNHPHLLVFINSFTKKFPVFRPNDRVDFHQPYTRLVWIMTNISIYPGLDLRQRCFGPFPIQFYSWAHYVKGKIRLDIHEYRSEESAQKLANSTGGRRILQNFRLVKSQRVSQISSAKIYFKFLEAP